VRDDEAACRGSNAPWPGPSQRRRQETPGAKIGVWLAGYRPLANFVKFFKAPRKFLVLFYPRAQFLFLKKCALAFASTRQAQAARLCSSRELFRCRTGEAHPKETGPVLGGGTGELGVLNEALRI